MHVYEYRTYSQRPEASDALELWLQVVVSHPAWLLGIKLGSLQEHHVLLPTKPSDYSALPSFLFFKIISFLRENDVGECTCLSVGILCACLLSVEIGRGR